MQLNEMLDVIESINDEEIVRLNEEDYDADEIEETKERAEFVANPLIDDFDELPSVFDADAQDTLHNGLQPQVNELESIGQVADIKDAADTL